MKQRIWEIDALRGICILGMVIVHLLYDLIYVFSLIRLDAQWFTFLLNWGGVLFFLISGISATLGSRSVRRGLIVFGCGLVLTAVTGSMYLLGYAGKSMIISFGVLHCLGVCMILWPIFRRAPAWVLGILSIGAIALGMWMKTWPPVDYPYLMPLGVLYRGFATVDYFPVFPNLGYFLLGAAAGKLLYRNKTSLLPNVNSRMPLLAFLQLCGKLSLPIYMLHQPVLTLLCQIAVWLM